jgi:UDP-glucose:tetrahydrobiopterin glucosyltransferase
MSNRKLNIALLAPLVSPIAPPFLGGAQALLHDLAVGLARRRHRVTLFATSGSKLETRDSDIQLRTIEVQTGELAPADFNNKTGMLSSAGFKAFTRQMELFLQTLLQVNREHFDIAHAHAFDAPVYATAPLSRVPVVHTVHLPNVDRTITSLLNITKAEIGHSRAVTVSQTCAATYGNPHPFDRIIYNGIKTESVTFGTKGESFLLFAGRITPEKGVDVAIRIAQEAGRKLVIAGGVYDRQYFDEEIRPRLDADKNLIFTGILERAELYKLMGRADGLLFPSRWDEPFGLVMVESLAAGTPVIASRKGAAQEIVEDGKTGFLIGNENIAEGVTAVARLGEIDRRACRTLVEDRFSFERMLDEYEQYYYATLGLGDRG